ncbi:MAG: methyltransferase domain-containing protein [Candidatus Hydrogenedentes bacterium]|nr:methyltransferase domain-containing protein [Candidatus Hydrogenedentota bacterium]
MTQVECPACGSLPTGPMRRRGGGLYNHCPACATQWRPEGATFHNYNSDYFHNRAHNDTDSSVSRAKLQTFRRFWRTITSTEPSGPILEIGCSAGLALRAGLEAGLDVYGFDVTKDILPLVQANGVGPERVAVGNLADIPNRNYAVCAFFDSFEHVPEPGPFLDRLAEVLAPDCLLLMVLPMADTLSNHLLGGLWPHYLPDHWVHYTKKGLTTLLNARGFTLKHWFYPAKKVPAQMVRRHVAMRWPWAAKLVCGNASLWFNIGERGSLWKRTGRPFSGTPAK